MNPLQPPDHWDFAMLTTQRAKAIEVFGFSERQARFLLTVMLHSGVFVERQYCAFAGIVHGQKTRKFFAKLVRLRYASMYDCRHNRARVSLISAPSTPPSASRTIDCGNP